MTIGIFPRTGHFWGCNIIPKGKRSVDVHLTIQAAQKTYDAFEMLADTFDRLYLFVLRLHESLSAKMITATMLETYALVVIHVFKIVNLATRYAQQGNSKIFLFVLISGFYWKSLFDPQDELFKLVAGFNQYAVQEIATQVSQINLLLERQSTVMDGISRDVGLLLQESQESSYHVRRTSELLEKMSAGIILNPSS